MINLFEFSTVTECKRFVIERLLPHKPLPIELNSREEKIVAKNF